MRTLILTLALLATPSALAKPWNGIEPGVTTKDDVLKRFGPPTKALESGGKEILAYLDKEAIKGTAQVQFRVAPGSGLIERVDVFPGPVVERDAVENSFGPACPASGTPQAQPCYLKRLTDDFRTYFLYSKLGLAVFFNTDGKTVQSFVYQPVKPEPTTKPGTK